MVRKLTQFLRISKHFTKKQKTIFFFKQIKTSLRLENTAVEYNIVLLTCFNAPCPNRGANRIIKYTRNSRLISKKR